jgi:hypothetical protein
MRLVLAAALLAAGPALAQEGDCARLAEAVEDDLLPAPWVDERDEIVEIARTGNQQACLAAFDLIRPSPPTMPADLPAVCRELRDFLADDGLPDGSEERLDALTIAIGEGDAEGCTRGLAALGIGGG